MGALGRIFREDIGSALAPQVSSHDRRLAGVAWPCIMLLLGAWTAWKRHHHGASSGLTPWVLAVAAPALAAALLSGPAIGDRVYRAVMLCFMTVGFFISRLALLVVFYAVVTPMGLAMRLAGKDLLQTRPSVRPSWTPRAQGVTERRRYYRLF